MTWPRSWMVCLNNIRRGFRSTRQHGSFLCILAVIARPTYTPIFERFSLNRGTWYFVSSFFSKEREEDLGARKLYIQSVSLFSAQRPWVFVSLIVKGVVRPLVVSQNGIQTSIQQQRQVMPRCVFRIRKFLRFSGQENQAFFSHNKHTMRPLFPPVLVKVSATREGWIVAVVILVIMVLILCQYSSSSSRSSPATTTNKMKVVRKVELYFSQCSLVLVLVVLLVPVHKGLTTRIDTSISAAIKFTLHSLREGSAEVF